MKVTALILLGLVAYSTALNIRQADGAAPAAGKDATEPNDVDDNTPPELVTLKCYANVEISAGSKPNVGSSTWWTAQYPTMQDLVKMCSTDETKVDLELSEQYKKLMMAAGVTSYPIPRGKTLTFVQGDKDGPSFSIPFFKSEVQNLPGTKFDGILHCAKTWADTHLQLKYCHATNEPVAAGAAAPAAAPGGAKAPVNP